MKSLAELALVLGPFFLVGTVAVPLVILGVAVNRASEVEDWTQDGLVWGLVAAAVVSAFIFVPPYVNATELCQDMKSDRDIENIIENALGKQTVSDTDLAWVENKCDDMIFV